MTREETIKAIQDFIGWFKEDSLIRKAFEMAIQALSQEPCTDAVSREWLMRKATERFYTTNYFNHISAMIEEAPSVTQKSGKWIDYSDEGRVETLEKQMKEDEEEQLKKLKAELDYAKFRCAL